MPARVMTVAGEKRAAVDPQAVFLASLDRSGTIRPTTGASGVFPTRLRPGFDGRRGDEVGDRRDDEGYPRFQDLEGHDVPPGISRL